VSVYNREFKNKIYLFLTKVLKLLLDEDVVGGGGGGKYRTGTRFGSIEPHVGKFGGGKGN
jgi:hypothetical protein